jgi:hypothetical protein
MKQKQHTAIATVMEVRVKYKHLHKQISALHREMIEDFLT